MKKNPVFKWLAISFLLGISIFCYTMYAKVTAPSISPNTNANSDTTQLMPNPKLPVEKPKTIYNSLPRSSYRINGVTVQNIGGMGQDKLQAVHSLGNNTFVIFDTASDSYDIKSSKKTVAIALIDNSLTVHNILVIPTESDEFFGSSKVTSDGILLITHSTEYTKLYKVDFNLNMVNEIQLEASISSYMYFTEGGIYLFISHTDKLCTKYIKPNFEVSNTSSMTIENSEIVDIFPCADGFKIYINGDNYYGFVNYSYSSGLKSNNLIYGYSVKQIFPTTEKGKLKFGALLYGENGYRIIKMDKEMDTVASYEIGDAESCFMFPLGENFWVYKLDDTEAKTMLFCTHLDMVFETPTEHEIISSKIYKYNQPELRLFAFNKNHELLILSTTGSAPTLINSYQAEQSYAYIDSNGTIYFTSASKQNYFTKNYGDYDIFIIKNSGD